MREARAKGRRPHKATHRTPNGIPASNLRRSDSPRRTIRRIPRRIPDVRFSRDPSSSWRPSWQPSSSFSPWKWLLAVSILKGSHIHSPGYSWEGSGRRFSTKKMVITHHRPHTDGRVVVDARENCQENFLEKIDFFQRLFAAIVRGAVSVVCECCSHGTQAACVRSIARWYHRLLLVVFLLVDVSVFSTRCREPQPWSRRAYTPPAACGPSSHRPRLPWRPAPRR